MGTGRTSNRASPLSRESRVTHLSYEEVDFKLRSLAEQIKLTKNVDGIWPKYDTDYTAAALLAYFLSVPIVMNGDVYSHYSGQGIDISLVKKNSWTDLYNDNTELFIDEVEVDENGNFQKVTLPWQK